MFNVERSQRPVSVICTGTKISGEVRKHEITED